MRLPTKKKINKDMYINRNPFNRFRIIRWTLSKNTFGVSKGKIHESNKLRNWKCWWGLPGEWGFVSVWVGRTGSVIKGSGGAIAGSIGAENEMEMKTQKGSSSRIRRFMFKNVFSPTEKKEKKKNRDNRRERMPCLGILNKLYFLCFQSFNFEMNVWYNTSSTSSVVSTTSKYILSFFTRVCKRVQKDWCTSIMMCGQLF